MQQENKEEEKKRMHTYSQKGGKEKSKKILHTHNEKHSGKKKEEKKTRSKTFLFSTHLHKH